ncbi:signal transduction histidine kinase [Desulfallas thermosapovorans DSM 6562]|uniref:histidine kinase n=2 Tax=Desulfallas thermosapovorans TaxID=58137 RepID=A0A5S4ZWW8_9FIRM|nr:signal transduction histidine kinase [Desulfallas thermosapovorans DSM 6562]
MDNLFTYIANIDILLPPSIYIEKILQVLCDKLGYSFSSVIEVDEQGMGWMIASYNLPANYPHDVNQKAPVLSSPSGEAISTGHIVVVNNPSQEPRLAAWYDMINQYNIKTIIWVPLISNGTAFGTYVLYDTRLRNTPQEELNVLKQISVMISIAIYSNNYLDQLNQKTSELEKEITRRKQIEITLREKESFLAGVIESIQDGLCVIDSDFNIIRANTTVERWNFQQRPLAGKKCYQAFKGRTEICDRCPAYDTLTTGTSSYVLVTMKDPGGDIVGWKEIYSFPLVLKKLDKIEGVILYVRDVTEKLKTEQEMARLEKFNLIGAMAAGIGHEIRNPMTTVRGFLQLLREKKECAQYGGYYNLMIEELDRANNIISTFLSLAKDKPKNLQIQSLNAIIESIYPLLLADATVSDLNITLELNNIPDLYLDPEEIRQLILNLVRNGLDAMSPGGTLTIKTYADRGEVILAVRDEGSGISPEILGKLGTPFFTTKDNGTGLGLAICYSIADRHNAELQIETGPGGSTFSARFKLNSE